MMTTGNEIIIPHNWQPRHYQLPVLKYFADGGRRANLIWHRRAGKDDLALNLAAIESIRRPANYWHMLPLYSQARKAVWDSITNGRRRIDQAFPDPIRSATRKQDMAVELLTGSIWQCVGSDNYNSLVGSPPRGIVFSEWALADPSAWAYLRPILRENDGWALFITTPRGKNHAYRMFKGALDDDEWFAQLLTVDDTGVFSQADLDRELEELTREIGDRDEAEAIFRQEYYCSFEAPIRGSYYGRILEQADRDGRITAVPWEPMVPVGTAWDLGYGDATAIWFYQLVGPQVRIIDYYEASGASLDHYVKVLREKPYAYDPATLPHDAAVGELGTGKTRVEVLRSLGVRVKVLPRTPVDDGINAVRQLLPRCWFDATRCEHGLDALRSYRKEWDDKRMDYRIKPVHDWTSHAADAFRYLAMGIKRPPRPTTTKRLARAITD